MAKTFQHPGIVMPFTAPVGGVTAGTPVLIGKLLVIPQVTAAAGATFEGMTVGVHGPLPKADAQAWTEGAEIYWDDAAKNFTTTANGNTLVGVAAYAVAATAGLVTGYVRLDGVAR